MMRELITKWNQGFSGFLSKRGGLGSLIVVGHIILLLFLGGILSYGWRNITYPIIYQVEQCEEYVIEEGVIEGNMSIMTKNGNQLIHVSYPYYLTDSDTRVVGTQADLRKNTNDYDEITFYKYSSWSTGQSVMGNVNAYHIWKGVLIVLGFLETLFFLVFVLFGFGKIEPQENRMAFGKKRSSAAKTFIHIIAAVIVIGMMCVYIYGAGIMLGTLFI